MANHPMIIDSHVHLYPRAEVGTLAWCNEEHPLRGQYSVDEYLSAIREPAKVRGFVFIETDRSNDLNSEEGWDQPLGEVDWITRVAAGTPRLGEGHTSEHAQYCLAIVPWAPIPLGPEALCAYVEKVNTRAGSCSNLIKGFRYLVQDKPKGTMTQQGFINSIRWLGEHGYTFDLGVDQRSGGDWQLDEAVEMIRKAHDGIVQDKKVTVVISRTLSPAKSTNKAIKDNPDHMCKPDMKIPGEYHEQNWNASSANLAFKNWAVHIRGLASLSKTYMKISGAFSELGGPLGPHQETMDFWSRAELIAKTYAWIFAWIDLTRKEFGPTRIMFGSDWPVCNVGGGGNSVAWMNVSLFFELIPQSHIKRKLKDIARGSVPTVFFSGPQFFS